jgi:hypothetical protein
MAILAFGFAARSLALVDEDLRGGNELVNQVVCLDAEALAAAHFDVRAGEVFVRNSVAKLDGAARGERHHLVAEMRVAVGLLRVAHAAQRLDHVGLGIGLARVDDVIDGLRTAEVWMVRLDSLLGRYPALMIGVT